MSVPTHGPFCETLIYETTCWSCQQEIYVLQCSCGSAVLFDDIGRPWPKHVCAGTGNAGGIGGSGLSGWQAIDVLQAHGAPITHEIMKKAFPNDRQEKPKIDPTLETKKISPRVGEKKDSLLVVRELHEHTKKIKDIQNLSDMGMKMLGLDPKKRYRQITLVDNSVRPNRSYTALVPDHLVYDVEVNKIVMVEMAARIRGDFSHWLIISINVL